MCVHYDETHQNVVKNVKHISLEIGALEEYGYESVQTVDNHKSDWNKSLVAIN